jgi:hypothetical protein
VTAADSGSEPWQADRRFVLDVKTIARDYWASVIVVTHPRDGNPKHGNDKRRSVRLERFLPLMDIPGLQWFSPQVGDAPRAQIAELGAEPLFIDLAPDLKDFGDTAAALAALDLLVSVDTAPVHLAGALARPVWVLMPFAPDWRWRLHRADTPWYPTMRLVRQPKVGDWDSVFETVRIDLLALAGKKRR